jgi:hypothetical protein
LVRSVQKNVFIALKISLQVHLFRSPDKHSNSSEKEMVLKYRWQARISGCNICERGEIDHGRRWESGKRILSCTFSEQVVLMGISLMSGAIDNALFSSIFHAEGGALIGRT